MALGWIIDPGSAQFDLNDLTSTFVRGQSLPMPEPRTQYVSAVDVDGDTPYSSSYANRTITLTVEVKGTSASDLETTMGYLHQKVATINREAVASGDGIGGFLQYTSPSGAVIAFDVCSVTASAELDATYFFGFLSTVTLTFACKPLWRGAEVTLSDHVETSLPCLIFTETSIPGDGLAEARLVVDDDQGADQWWFTYGVQSRNYDSSNDAKLFYEAEGRTRLASATTTGTSGASASIAVRSPSLSPNYLAILSTQATGGGNHLTHVGEFRAYARVQTPSANTGAVSVALEWGLGDFRDYTRNASTTFPVDEYDGTWRLVDLGLINVPQIATGTQRWEGRVLAASTVAGDVIDVDYLFLVPTAEGSATVVASPTLSTPTSLTMRDEFDQAAGALNTKTAAVGGTWATANASGIGTGAFAVTASHTAARSPNGDSSASPGQYAILGSSTLTDVVVQADSAISLGASGGAATAAVVARYTDTSNLVRAGITASGTAGNVTFTFFVEKRVAGVATFLGTATAGVSPDSITGTLKLVIDAGGRFALVSGNATVVVGQDSALATGGTLASGKCGIAASGTASTATCTFDNFLAAPVVSDAAVFASQSAEMRHNVYIREDSTGTFWVEKTIEGDYPALPPSGLEGRTLRVIVKLCRNDPATMPDSAIDDLSAQLFVTPRGLLLPE
jgi:hypothetical protein